MDRSTDRILTTHTGSLPRPKDLIELLMAKEAGKPYDEAAFHARVASAVDEVVKKQIDSGIDLVSDGEMGKISYVGYAKDRMTGFGGKATLGIGLDLAEFPGYSVNGQRHNAAGPAPRPACDAPITYTGMQEATRDIANMQAALAKHSPRGHFMTACAPGVITVFLPNIFYASHEEYIWALAAAMKEEFQEIGKSGLTMQIDCPDLALSRHVRWGDKTLAEWKALVSTHIEAMNWALEGIPGDQLRMHLCWGNYEGPHHYDVPLRDILDLVFTAKPNMISIEGANPRHEHEWEVWQDVPLPQDKVLIPGVIDSTNNFVEHPELIAQRILRYARLVGRERVIAGGDCGFATGAQGGKVYPDFVWMKFQAMAEGARLASKQLWG